MKLLRAETLRFELADGRALLVPPVTRAQVRAALALDRPADAPQIESPPEADERRAHQLALLIAHGAVDGRPVDAAFLGSLTAPEEHDILAAIIAHHHGFNPLDAVALQATLRRLAFKKKVLGEIPAIPSSTSMPTPSTSPIA